MILGRRSRSLARLSVPPNSQCCHSEFTVSADMTKVLPSPTEADANGSINAPLAVSMGEPVRFTHQRMLEWAARRNQTFPAYVCAVPSSDASTGCKGLQDEAGQCYATTLQQEFG